ncbi:MAG: TonB family protein [Saprospiraceae bacterium]|nr:TonB family protein [Saprospiraceae bacterium]
MKRIVNKYSTLNTLLVFLLFGCTEFSIAQIGMESSTTEAILSEALLPEEDQPQENLDYMVTTWSSPVTKTEVRKITSIMDFWSEEERAKQKLDGFKEIWVVNLKDYPDWTLDVNEIQDEYKAISPTVEYTKEQLAIIENAEYSDHLRFSARFNSVRLSTGKVKENVLISQSMSLVPDVQAAYQGGFDALVDHLKVSSKEKVKHVQRDKVGICRVFFTVSKLGTITNVNMVESSNYPDVDEAMIKIVKEIPLKWTPAQDGNGAQVDQEFVFTFGVAGC